MSRRHAGAAAAFAAAAAGLSADKLTSGSGDRVAALAAVRRALTGLAVGDALGADLEFLRDPGAAELAAAAAAPVLAVTDDTQMALFVAEGLLTSPLHRLLPGIEAALLRWYRLQVGLVPTRRRGLLRFDVLARKRAPGITCMSSLRHRHAGSQRPDNDSKGAGSLMRAAPLLLLPELCAGEARALIAAQTRITHDHPLAAQADVFFVSLLHRLAVTAPAVPSGAVAGGEVAGGEEGAVLGEALCRSARALAAELAAAGAVTDELLDWVERGLTIDAPARIGAGWVAEEALAIALSAARQADGDFMRGMACAICHGGDSDTTGAIAGALLGVLGVLPEASLCARLDALPALHYIADLLAGWPARQTRNSVVGGGGA